MNVGSPKLLIISKTEQKDESEEEEVNFQPHVTPHERLKHTLSVFFGHIIVLLQLLGSFLRWGRRRGRGQVANNEAASEGVGAEEEGWGNIPSRGSLDHNPIRAEPEVTSEVLQMEMEAATPLPGENVTTPSGEATRWGPTEAKQEVDPSSIPLPTSHSPLSSQ